ncbi:recombinase family protein [Paenibacillus sp. TRM 82003]|nr:recombinase family protein [Paenibacillus sp. TRM 82003]
MMSGKRCTFYARCSTDTELQTNSIKNQISGLMKYAKDNGYSLVDEGVFCRRNGNHESYQGYIDEGFSGAKSAKYRKAFQKMINDARAGLFDVILTKSISRFGRNVKEMLVYIDELKKIGVGVWFEDIKAFSLDPTHTVKIQIFASLAEEESRSKSDSIQWAKKEATRNKGIWSGREPYGYNLSEGKLIVNQEEAEIVRNIFRMYVEDSHGVNKIARILETKAEVASKRGGRWTGNHIAKIIKNEVYIGQVRLHRTRKSDINLGKIEKIPLDKQIQYKDETLRIVSDDVFNLAQIEKGKRPHIENFMYRTIRTIDIEGQEVERKQRTGAKTTGRPRHSSEHLFSNLLRCVNCGGSMRKKVQTSSAGVTHHYYYCRNHEQYGYKICGYRNLQKEHELLEWVKSEIKSYREDSTRHNKNFEYYISTQYDLNEVSGKIEKLKEQIEELKQDEEANFKLYSRGKVSEERYDERNERITTELSDLDRELKRLTFIDKEIESAKFKFENFINYLNEIDIENLSNGVLRKVIDHIDIFTHDDQIIRDIEWSFMGSTEYAIQDEHNIKELKELGIIK